MDATCCCRYKLLEVLLVKAEDVLIALIPSSVLSSSGPVTAPRSPRFLKRSTSIASSPAVIVSSEIAAAAAAASTMVASRQKKALIVGGGPVGALTALSLHKRGWEVEVWEGRDGMHGYDQRLVTDRARLDPRAADVSPFTLRSINLAISARGLAALRSVDPSLGWSIGNDYGKILTQYAAEDFLEQAIPMKGRMIHHVDGK